MSDYPKPTDDMSTWRKVMYHGNTWVPWALMLVAMVYDQAPATVVFAALFIVSAIRQQISEVAWIFAKAMDEQNAAKVRSFR